MSEVSISVPIDVLECLGKNDMFSKNFIILAGVVNSCKGCLTETTKAYSKFKGFDISKSLVFYDLHSLISKSIVRSSATNTPIFTLTSSSQKSIALSSKDCEDICNLSNANAFVVYVAMLYLTKVRCSEVISDISYDISKMTGLSNSDISLAIKCLSRYKKDKVSVVGKIGRAKSYLVK